MSREDGISILSVVVALGLSGILMVVVSRILDQQRKVMNQIRWQSEKEDLRGALRRAVNCQLLSCEQQSENLPEELASWRIRGSCGEDGLLVEVRRLNRFGNPARHPLTEKTAGWEPLFPETSPFLCPPGPQTTNQQQNSAHSEQYAPSQSIAPQERTPVPSEDVLRQLDPETLKELLEKTNEAIQQLCPPGKALTGIDTENMLPVCE